MISEAIFQGFALSIGLLLAIGPQNTYIIRMGVARQKILLVTTVCALADCCLIFLGSMGVASIFSKSYILHFMLVCMGIIFLIYLGIKAWIEAYSGTGTAKALNQAVAATSNKKIILTALGFSLLNPGALMDTFILIGGVASHYKTYMMRFYFTCGAMLASVVWFYALGLLANLLSPVFKNPRAAHVLDFFVGIIMFAIAFMLIEHELWPKLDLIF